MEQRLGLPDRLKHSVVALWLVDHMLSDLSLDHRVSILLYRQQLLLKLNDLAQKP